MKFLGKNGNLFKTQLFGLKFKLREIILAWNYICQRRRDEAGDPVGGHFRKTTPALQPAACSVAWDLRFPIGISRLTGFKYKQMQSKMR